LERIRPLFSCNVARWPGAPGLLCTGRHRASMQPRRARRVGRVCLDDQLAHAEITIARQLRDTLTGQWPTKPREVGDGCGLVAGLLGVQTLDLRYSKSWLMTRKRGTDPEGASTRQATSSGAGQPDEMAWPVGQGDRLAGTALGPCQDHRRHDRKSFGDWHQKILGCRPPRSPLSAMARSLDRHETRSPPSAGTDDNGFETRRPCRAVSRAGALPSFAIALRPASTPHSTSARRPRDSAIGPGGVGLLALRRELREPQIRGL